MNSGRSRSKATTSILLCLALVLLFVRGAGLHPHVYTHAPSDRTHHHADHHHSSILAADSLNFGHYDHQDMGVDLSQVALAKRPLDLEPPVLALAFVLVLVSVSRISSVVQFGPDLRRFRPPPLGHLLRPPLRAPPF